VEGALEYQAADKREAVTESGLPCALPNHHTCRFKRPSAHQKPTINRGQPPRVVEQNVGKIADTSAQEMEFN